MPGLADRKRNERRLAGLKDRPPLPGATRPAEVGLDAEVEAGMLAKVVRLPGTAMLSEPRPWLLRRLDEHNRFACAEVLEALGWVGPQPLRSAVHVHWVELRPAGRSRGGHGGSIDARGRVRITGALRSCLRVDAAGAVLCEADTHAGVLRIYPSAFLGFALACARNVLERVDVPAVAEVRS